MAASKIPPDLQHTQELSFLFNSLWDIA